MTAASDDTLMASFGLGNPDATAAAFFRRFQGRVYGLARSMISDPHLAEDVAQEAFVRAWRSAAAYDSRRSSVHTRLLVITRNLATDATRLRRAQPVDPELFAALDLPMSGTVSPEGSAETRADMRILRVALDDLPSEQRQALLLAALCDRTAGEISEREGIPLGTAKTRIGAGLLKIRASMSTRRTEQRRTIGRPVDSWRICRPSWPWAVSGPERASPAPSAAEAAMEPLRPRQRPR